MNLQILLLGVTVYFMYGTVQCRDADGSNLSTASSNLTNPDKDMYVIHATVYQIGILTNKTDNMTNNSTGSQESVTLYHTNGTNVDLSKIPEPFLTNVTAQTMIGVAPIPKNNGDQSLNAWSGLDQLTHPMSTLGNIKRSNAEENKVPLERTRKRSIDYNDIYSSLFKRDTANTTPVKVENGAALIPPEAGIQSISLPPLLSLNNNLTKIPVPIPNTSVVHYAKVNTLVTNP